MDVVTEPQGASSVDDIVIDRSSCPQIARDASDSLACEKYSQLNETSNPQSPLANRKCSEAEAETVEQTDVAERAASIEERDSIFPNSPSADRSASESLVCEGFLLFDMDEQTS